jgi:DNA-directed RNA polymerase delta subunit
VELKTLTKSQAEKIAEVERAYADLQRKKENVTASYRRLVAKHNAFMEKAEQEKDEIFRGLDGAW